MLSLLWVSTGIGYDSLDIHVHYALAACARTSIRLTVSKGSRANIEGKSEFRLLNSYREP
jgi:hypothetical protein